MLGDAEIFLMAAENMSCKINVVLTGKDIPGPSHIVEILAT